MPAIGCVICLFLIGVLLNSLSVCNMYRKGGNGGTCIVAAWEKEADHEEASGAGRTPNRTWETIQSEQIDTIFQCENCVHNLSNGRRFTYTMSKPPDCYTMGTPPPCLHGGAWYWLCVLNDTIGCYRLSTPEEARSGRARVRSKRRATQALVNASVIIPRKSPPNCTTCLNHEGKIAFRTGKPSTCTTTDTSHPVGSLLCLGTWEGGYGTWNSSASLPEPTWFNLTLLSFLNTSSPQKWPAPENMYWICGPIAYEWLPANWSGSCILGWIKPSFFLLPLTNRQHLGVPVYDTLGQDRKRREVDTAFSNFACKEAAHYDAEGTTWSSERIVCIYGAATWAKDDSWGYRTPIYMLNRIIRLQAVLHLAGERIDKALNILAQTTDRIRTAVYQNRLALDYLLAREGGVCGKFNLSNCCLEIGETGEVIEQLTTEMRQLTYNAPQEWTGFNLSGLFSSWLPKLPGLQTIVALIALIAAGCVILPCILPIFARFLSNGLSLLVERRAKVQALALWQYHQLAQRGDSEDEV